ncbi:extracellular solute-binding protein [Neobacillus kokaensis]|uniref:ABC transporter substrate-binding protein n=1 Tax=Neobacillus kokaensis TaxID=2759023 RepID=A0ABQ3MYQ9_9BACI|nr:extracellular solute-binding protein [Neobacillus kokaensis]GHH97808.1 ABC transporter substrate-binding protein [Neobacillus kokaensis]
MAPQFRKTSIRRLQAISIIVIFIIGTMLPLFNKPSSIAHAEEKLKSKETADADTFEKQLEPYYYEVVQKWKSDGVQPGSEQLKLDAGNFSNKSRDAGVTLGSYAGKDHALLWSTQNGWVEYNVNVKEEGLYEMAFEYAPFLQKDGGTRQSIIFNVQINGAYPFKESRAIELKREFRDEKPQYDEKGNQIRSLVEDITGWRTEALRESGGANVEPLLFHLKKGENIIRLQALRESVALKTIEIKSPETYKTYQEVKEEYPSNSGKNGKLITIEAENFSKKNSTSIQVQYDRDPLTTPESLKKIKFNTLGGSNWYQGGQAVTWEFDVPEDGTYKIGFRGMQNYRKNLATFRTVYIDGKIPFEELKHFRIPYASGWQEVILEGKGKSPYSIYLTKGKHTISLEATYEPFVPLIIQMDKLSNEIRAISQDLRLATGNQEDSFRVWNVEEELPGLLDKLKAMKKQIETMTKEMLKVNGERSNVSQALESIVQDLTYLLDEPGEIANSQVRIGALQDSLENQRQELMNSPLAVDKFYISPDKEEFPSMTANWFQKIQGSYNSLIYSFSDQNQLHQQSDKELNVWMMWGRDYAEELQQLANQYFTPKYGIKVNVNLIQDTNLLILAKSAGIMPDVALGVPSGMPFEMAVRGAAKDISTMPGAEKLLEQYAPGTLLPYYYDGGTYGIPETINFKVLFYRKDILDQLGLEVPQTWDDVYDMLPTLLQNHLNFYADPKDFSYMLYQNGVELYTPDGMETGLDQPEAFKGFEEWTNLFNLHGMDRQVQSFYQQFRKGLFPIGIADFNQYMQLLVAAPEIMDAWGIAPIPGHIDPSGANVRWAGGTGMGTTSMMLFNDTPKEKQELAWDFIKWYSSPEVQTEYGLNLEQFRGETFRWNSANVAAFSKMPWRKSDLQAILEQWKWEKDIANVPGGYMTTRQLDFAWNQTVLEGGNPRIELEKAVKAIKRELKRKQSEFHLIDENNKVLNPLDVPIISEPWKGVEPYEQ